MGPVLPHEALKAGAELDGTHCLAIHGGLRAGFPAASINCPDTLLGKGFFSLGKLATAACEHGITTIVHLFQGPTMRR